MEKIQLEIMGISFSQSQSGAYALILGETNGNRRLPVIIGGNEAQAIAIEIEKIKPSRPLTHDLFKTTAEAFGIKLEEILINRFTEGVFYAKLILFDGNIRKEIDSRTSDAVALAVRFRCPMYTFENIMVAAGVVLDEDDALSPSPKKQKEEIENESPYESNSLKELEDLLAKAIEKEDYETASTIRDIIKKRKL
ncbi:MAG: bifunctional nuclease domain-containing protein [Bacteroidota bacterium]